MSFLQFCLILGCYLYSGLPSGLFSLASATQILYSFPHLPVRATSPAYLIAVHIEEYKEQVRQYAVFAVLLTLLF